MVFYGTEHKNMLSFVFGVHWGQWGVERESNSHRNPQKWGRVQPPPAYLLVVSWRVVVMQNIHQR